MVDKWLNILSFIVLATLAAGFLMLLMFEDHWPGIILMGIGFWGIWVVGDICRQLHTPNRTE